MTTVRAFCPSCKGESDFAQSSDSTKCLTCGFEYAAPLVEAETRLERLGGFMSRLFGGIFYALLVVFGLICLALAVAFAGCLFAGMR